MKTYIYRGIPFTIDLTNTNEAVTYINRVKITFKPRRSLAHAKKHVENFIDNHLDGHIEIG